MERARAARAKDRGVVVRALLRLWCFVVAGRGFGRENFEKEWVE